MVAEARCCDAHAKWRGRFNVNQWVNTWLTTDLCHYFVMRKSITKIQLASLLRSAIEWNYNLRLLCSDMWNRIVGQKIPGISEDCAASIFTVFSMNMESVLFIETSTNFCLPARLRVTDFEKTIVTSIRDEMLLHFSLVWGTGNWKIDSEVVEKRGVGKRGEWRKNVCSIQSLLKAGRDIKLNKLI